MNTKTIRELRSIALHKGLHGYYKLNKADLVALLLEQSAEEMSTPPPHENVPRWIREVPEHLKTSEMSNKAVAGFSCALKYVPDYLKTQEMCSQAVSNNPYLLKHVPDHFKTQEMYEKAVEKDSWLLRHVSDRYKTQEIFEKAIEKDSLNLKYVPNDLSFWRCVKK